MSIEVRFPDRFLHIARAKSGPVGIGLRERMSEKLLPNAGHNTSGVSFQVRAPGGSNSLLDSHVRLTWPMDLYFVGGVNLHSKQTLYERCNGLLLAMDSISITYNNQTRAIRPRRDGIVQLCDAFQKVGRKNTDYGNLQISSDHYPSTHVCSTFAKNNDDKYDLTLHKEPYVEEKVRKFNMNSADNISFYKVLFSCCLPLAPFEGMYDELKHQIGMDVSRATPHVNLVNIEIAWNKNPLQYLLQQNPSTGKVVSGITSTKLNLAAIWALAQYDNAIAAAASNDPAIPIRLHTPYLELDWWSVPSSVQIPPQISAPAIQWDVHTQEVLSTVETGFSTKIE